MKRTPGFALAAGPTSRGAAPRWSKPGSAKPLWVATTGGISGYLSLIALTFWMNSIP